MTLIEIVRDMPPSEGKGKHRSVLRHTLVLAATVAFAIGFLGTVGGQRRVAVNPLETAVRGLSHGVLRQSVQIDGIVRKLHGPAQKRLKREAAEVAAEARSVVSTLTTSKEEGAGAERKALDVAPYVDADFDVHNPTLPDPIKYGYHQNPAFRYPEDRPEALGGDGINQYPWQLVSYMPRTYVIGDFISRPEAAEVIKAARPQMKRSEVAEFKEDADDKKEPHTESRMDDIRTSEGAWLTLSYRVVASLKKRIATITGYPVSAMEDLQVLKYQKGQLYESHHDFFDPKNYGKQDWNRVATFYFFLTDDFTGGQFALPLANGRSDPGESNQCTQGLRVSPKVGHAVLFYGMRPDRILDKFSLHTGCPVDSGVKWVGVVWIDHHGEAYSMYSEDSDSDSDSGSDSDSDSGSEESEAGSSES